MVAGATSSYVTDPVDDRSEDPNVLFMTSEVTDGGGHYDSSFRLWITHDGGSGTFVANIGHMCEVLVSRAQ